MKLRIRSSSCAPLFLGDDGLTDIQFTKLIELKSKIKLTESQARERDKLEMKHNSVELSSGAKSLIEDIIDQQVYKYEENFSNPKTQKGWDVESESCEIYNRIFFTSYHKQEAFDSYYELEHGISGGHPDIVDCERRKVIDLKSSWSKKSFPKTVNRAYNSNYEWQVKHYLYMLTKMTGEDWSDGEVAFILTTTPEELKPEYEDDSLHYMEDLEDELRATIVPVKLTSDDIVKMDKRLAAAEKYANEYHNLLKSKNK
jgi:hypothetical protein